MSQQLAGRRVAVLGAARSGVAAANLLAQRGARPLLSDLRSAEALTQWTGALDSSVELITGRNELADASLIVASPGVPPSAPPLREAASRGIPVWSEPELAFRLCEAPVIAITGTDGKSTVTVMTAHLLREAGRSVWVGGNLGNPFCEGVLKGETHREAWAVLEISCFQLLHVDAFRPRIAALLNIAADHLDVHGSMEDYARAKARVFEAQGSGDVAIYNADDPRCVAAVGPLSTRGVKLVPFGFGETAIEGWTSRDGLLTRLDGEEDFCGLMPRQELPLPGRHNVANALAALGACAAVGLRAEEMVAGLKTFRPLPHRLEPVGQRSGVRFINDSKATNPHAAAAGIRSLGSDPLILICGGVDKGLELELFVEAAAESTKLAFVFGAIRERLAEALRPVVPSVRVVDDMAMAMEAAVLEARLGDTILLSPACSSFDQFVSYGARGDAFRALVEAL